MSLVVCVLDHSLMKQITLNTDPLELRWPEKDSMPNGSTCDTEPFSIILNGRNERLCVAMSDRMWPLSTPVSG